MHTNLGFCHPMGVFHISKECTDRPLSKYRGQMSIQLITFMIFYRYKNGSSFCYLNRCQSCLHKCCAVFISCFIVFIFHFFTILMYSCPEDKSHSIPHTCWQMNGAQLWPSVPIIALNGPLLAYRLIAGSLTRQLLGRWAEKICLSSNLSQLLKR